MCSTGVEGPRYKPLNGSIVIPDVDFTMSDTLYLKTFILRLLFQDPRWFQFLRVFTVNQWRENLDLFQCRKWCRCWPDLGFQQLTRLSQLRVLIKMCKGFTEDSKTERELYFKYLDNDAVFSWGIKRFVG